MAGAQEEFEKANGRTRDLVADLEKKFSTVDTLIGELGKRDDEIMDLLNKTQPPVVQPPFIDPSTGRWSKSVDISTPPRPDRAAAAAQPQPQP